MAIQYGYPACEPLAARLSITGAAGSSNVFASLSNPWGVAVVVTRAILYISTASSGASTLDIGPAANATTASDTLIDGLSGAGTGVFDSSIAAHGGTNGLPSGLLAADGAITVKEASGNVDGLVATLVIQAVPA